MVELHLPIDDQMDWLPKFIVDQGVWIRPFRNLIYIMPPFIIETDDLSCLTVAIGKILEQLSKLNRV